MQRQPAKRALACIRALTINQSDGCSLVRSVRCFRETLSALSADSSDIPGRSHVKQVHLIPPVGSAHLKVTG